MNDMFDITDNDIVETIDTIYGSDRPNTKEKFFENASIEYNRTLIIVFDRLCIMNSNEVYVERTICRMLRKIYSLFDLYGIEYSDTYLKQSFLNSVVTDCKIGSVNVLSDYDCMVSSKMVYAVICFNCPEFSHMTALRFIKKLNDIAFKHCRLEVVKNLQMYNDVFPDCYQYTKHCFSFNRDYGTEPVFNDVSSIIEWRFFYRIIHMFFGIEEVSRLSELVKKHKNPFTGEPMLIDVKTKKSINKKCRYETHLTRTTDSICLNP